MRGVITAAARSPRLLPITKHIPASLLEVGDKAIIAHQLEALQKAGVKSTLVITGYCADQVDEFCSGKASCVFNPFYDVCNVAMNLWLVRQELKSGFILIYNDILFQAKLIEELLAIEEHIVLVVDKKGLDKEAEKVDLRQGVVSAIGKDIADPYGEFIGIAMFSRDVISVLIEELEKVARTDLSTTFPQLVELLVQHYQNVKVLATDRPWIDIDFPHELEEARRMWGY
jgi:choline kinase